jgi:DNA recombination protein RmuC
MRAELREQRGEVAQLSARDRDERLAAHRELRDDLERARTEAATRLLQHAETARVAGDELRTALLRQVAELREENERKLEAVRETVGEKLQGTLTASLKENADRVEALTRANAEKHAELQRLLKEELEALRQGNEAKLEKMRETVDEKLQGTLEKRLGESFNLVSSRLEQVQKGLGEMQSLASDVGGLKRVLTNVKSRGGWGEVQLSRQLEDILTKDQYEENVAVRPGSSERVEFAVRLPGRGDGDAVYLAIDSKLPQEDYERLLDANEGGDKAAIDDAGRALERAIVEQAKTISSKYIVPPHTTDFAILYLPTEGLFAEVVRRPGLASRLQSEHRILITGPTTLMSLLNSLQMGFRTLAIEQRSSEVWQVLAAAKGEFQKYGQVWSKLEKQLQTAQNTVSEAGRRTRAVERKLRDVESIESAAPTTIDEILSDVEEAQTPSASDSQVLEGLGVGRDEIDSTLVSPHLDVDDDARAS